MCSVTVSTSKQARHDILLTDAKQNAHSLQVSQVVLRNMPDNFNDQQREEHREEAPPIEDDDDINSYVDMDAEIVGPPPEYHFHDGLVPENSIL